MSLRGIAAIAAICFLAWEPVHLAADPKLVEAPNLVPPPPVEAKPLPPLTNTVPEFDIRRRVIKIDGPTTARLYKNNLYSVSIEGVDSKRIEDEVESGNLAFDWVIETDRADRYDIVSTVNQAQLLFTAEPGKYRIWLSVGQLEPFRTRTAYLDITFPGKAPDDNNNDNTDTTFKDLEELAISRIGALVQLPTEQKKLDCQNIAAVYYDMANTVGKPGFVTPEEFNPAARKKIDAILVAGSNRLEAWKATRVAIAQYSLQLEQEGKLKPPQYKSYFLALHRAFTKAGG